mgnify:CR=1 FL=1
MSIHLHSLSDALPPQRGTGDIYKDILDSDSESTGWENETSASESSMPGAEAHDPLPRNLWADPVTGKIYATRDFNYGHVFSSTELAGAPSSTDTGNVGTYIAIPGSYRSIQPIYMGQEIIKSGKTEPIWTKFESIFVDPSQTGGGVQIKKTETLEFTESGYLDKIPLDCPPSNERASGGLVMRHNGTITEQDFLEKYTLSMGPKYLFKRQPRVTDGEDPKYINMYDGQNWLNVYPLTCREPDSESPRYPRWTSTVMPYDIGLNESNRIEERPTRSNCIRIHKNFSEVSQEISDPDHGTYGVEIMASRSLNLMERYEMNFRDSRPYPECIQMFGDAGDREEKGIRGRGGKVEITTITDRPYNAFFTTALAALVRRDRLTDPATMMARHVSIVMSEKSNLSDLMDALRLLMHPHPSVLPSFFDACGSGRAIRVGLMRDMILECPMKSIFDTIAEYTDHTYNGDPKSTYAELFKPLNDASELLNRVRYDDISTGMEMTLEQTLQNMTNYFRRFIVGPSENPGVDASKYTFYSVMHSLRVLKETTGGNSVYLANVGFWNEIAEASNIFNHYFTMARMHGIERDPDILREWMQLTQYAVKGMETLAGYFRLDTNQQGLYEYITNRDTYVSIFHIYYASYAATHLVYAATDFCDSPVDDLLDDPYGAVGLKHAISELFGHMISIMNECNTKQDELNEIYKFKNDEQLLNKFKESAESAKGFLYKNPTNVQEEYHKKHQEAKKSVGFYDSKHNIWKDLQLAYILFNGDEIDSLAAEILQIGKYYSDDNSDFMYIKKNDMHVLETAMQYDFYASPGHTETADTHRWLSFARAGLQLPKSRLQTPQPPAFSLRPPGGGWETWKSPTSEINTRGYALVSAESQSAVAGQASLAPGFRYFSNSDYVGLHIPNQETDINIFIQSTHDLGRKLWRTYTRDEYTVPESVGGAPGLPMTARIPKLSPPLDLYIATDIEFEIVKIGPAEAPTVYRIPRTDAQLSEIQITRHIPVNYYLTDSTYRQVKGLRYAGHEMIEGPIFPGDDENKRVYHHAAVCAFPGILINERVWDTYFKKRGNVGKAVLKYWERYMIDLEFKSDAKYFDIVKAQKIYPTTAINRMNAECYIENDTAKKSKAYDGYISKVLVNSIYFVYEVDGEEKTEKIPNNPAAIEACSLKRVMKYVFVPCRDFGSPKASIEAVWKHVGECEVANHNDMVNHKCADGYTVNLHLAGHLANEPSAGNFGTNMEVQTGVGYNVVDGSPITTEILELTKPEGIPEWVDFHYGAYVVCTCKEGQARIKHGDELVWCYGSDYAGRNGYDEPGPLCL